jgi:predicted RNA-binding protein with PIN domain
LEVNISSIIIDGYNLIGIHHRDLEQQRNKLIEMLVEYKKFSGHNIILVFDGWKSGSSEETSLVLNGIRVIYSRLGEKADSVIKRLVHSEKRKWIVVSSDREVSDHTWRHESVAVSSDEFMNAIEKNRKFVEGEYEPLDETGCLRKKGSSRTLSKKEKEKKRVLNKL